ncbi:MAG: tetratricopeptide repeat protein [Proteobacteria bacterium]|nr:tetratricopeptide repeat protein [Pseudomonadota bacterium]
MSSDSGSDRTALLASGKEMMRAGKLVEAEQVFRQILEIEPEEPDALHLLGLARFQTGHHEKAVQFIKRAITFGPPNHDYLNNLGQIYKMTGSLTEASEYFRQALELNPEYIDAHINLGNTLKDMGRIEDAVDSFLKALDLNPDLAELQNNLGNALKRLGRLEEAIAGYRKALSINPDFAEAHNNLGNALQDQRKLEDAVDSYDKAIALNPDFAEAHSNLGNLLVKLGQFDEALSCFQKSLALNPDYAEGHFNLGCALQKLGEPEEAVARFQKAVSINPNYAEAQNNLGQAFHDLGNLEEAVVCSQKALVLKPDFAEAHNNLGYALLGLGNLEEAMASFDKALVLKPDFAEAHYNLGHALLYDGDLGRGWEEFAWRWNVESLSLRAIDARPQPLWQGQDVGGKTILVWGEQGIGDEVLFAGMVSDLMDQGAKVVMECDPRLIPLYERSFDGGRCIALTDPPAEDALRPEIDFQVPSGNLGRWLRPTLDAFPDRPRYLRPDQNRSDALKQGYQGGSDDKLVGIAWNSKSTKLGRNKSLPLSALRPLANVPGVRLVDLQYGDTAIERKEFEDATGAAILHDDSIDHMADLDAFAAQVAAMDLVISVSNTTVHIAGAMGVPTWVLLNLVPLSCWMLKGDTSPWYASLTLFRQTEAGEWADMIEAVARALSKDDRGMKP